MLVRKWLALKLGWGGAIHDNYTESDPFLNSVSGSVSADTGTGWSEISQTVSLRLYCRHWSVSTCPTHNMLELCGWRCEEEREVEWDTVFSVFHLAVMPCFVCLLLSLATQVCHSCFRHQPNLHRCAQCKFAHYCDRTCQTACWDEHKQECAAIKKMVMAPSEHIR